MVFFCRVILLHIVKGFLLKARILLIFNFFFFSRTGFPSNLWPQPGHCLDPHSWCSSSLASMRSELLTQLKLLILFMVWWIDMMLLLSLLIKLYEAFNWISLTLETQHLSLSLVYNRSLIEIKTKTFLKYQEKKLDGMLQS